MKIIITGATGFIGRNLAESLHDDGLQVLATGRSETIGDELINKGIEFLPADILDRARLSSVFSSADCVIHCAARSGDWGRYKDFYRPNVLGTRNVIEACERHGINKIIFISTPSIYFTGKDRLDITESDPLPNRQSTHYARTKLISEQELLALRQRGFRVIVFRPRAVYGPHDSTFVPRVLKMAEKKHMPLINNGRALVDITCVQNFVDAVRNSLTAADDVYNEVYNISNGDPITIREWTAQMLTILERPFNPQNIPEPLALLIGGSMELLGHLPFGPRTPILTRFAVGYMAKSMTLSIDKARAKLGYSPRISNQQGFEQYASWYRAQGAG